MEEYNRYLDNVSALDDETKMELLRFEHWRRQRLDRMLTPEYLTGFANTFDEVAEEKAKCQTTS